MTDQILVNSEGKELVVEHLYTVEGYFTLSIKVKSGEFAGASNFCMPKESVVSIIETLSIMNKDLKGCCEVKDYDSDAYVIVEMDKFGHVALCGQIGGSHEEHFMKFKYETDQTILEKLIRIFKSLL